MNKKGFTLIELLISIVIISILALALLPVILTGPEDAREAVVDVHLGERTNYCV